jgi:hypothetical protein
MRRPAPPALRIDPRMKNGWSRERGPAVLAQQALQRFRATWLPVRVK